MLAMSVISFARDRKFTEVGCSLGFVAKFRLQATVKFQISTVTKPYHVNFATDELYYVYLCDKLCTLLI